MIFRIVDNGIFVILCTVFVFIPSINCQTKQPSKSPVQYRLRQIMMEPVVSPQDDAEIRKQAEAILARASSGEDFTALVKRYSQEPDAQKTGGDLGFFTYIEERLQKKMID